MEIITAKKKLMTLLLRNFATTTSLEFLISKTSCRKEICLTICFDLRKNLDYCITPLLKHL